MLSKNDTPSIYSQKRQRDFIEFQLFFSPENNMLVLSKDLKSLPVN